MKIIWKINVDKLDGTGRHVMHRKKKSIETLTPTWNSSVSCLLVTEFCVEEIETPKMFEEV
jgi:hypothetical protein